MQIPRFTVALIADTHTRPPQGDDSSPWEVNERANDRARHVVARVNQLRPAFAIHLGDIVHPVPSLPSYEDAAGAARQIMSALECPCHYVPGNHDIGDKPFPANPAGRVSDAALASYRHHFGEPYSLVEHEDCSFILINSPILNSGLEDELRQREWLSARFEAARGRRIFLVSHYPPYVCDPGEPSNYDNLDQPARAWLLDLVQRHRVEALFAGHVHNFFYHRHGGTDCYLLPATSFFRQDYAELFRVEAADQHGRNDTGKLGFFTLDVYPVGHVARLWRTDGAQLEHGARLPAAAGGTASLHPRQGARAPLGVHLRHPWAEITELPYNGPMDEFHRKQARNDHTLLALWDLGVRHLRVPLSDLLQEPIRERMRALLDMGQRFTVFSFQVPPPEVVDEMVKLAALVHAFEFVIPWDTHAQVLPLLAALRSRSARPVLLSKMESSAQRKANGSRFSHYISYGFTCAEDDMVEEFLSLPAARDAVDGLVYRVALDEDLWTASGRLDRIMARHGLVGVVNVRLASENPAEYVTDDAAIAGRTAEALCAAHCARHLELFLDTFVDLDRGYFPRHGLFDRRLNPRPAAFVYRHLQAALGAGDAAPERIPDAGRIRFRQGASELELLRGPAKPAAAGTVTVTLLERGEEHRVAAGAAVPQARAGAPMLLRRKPAAEPAHPS